jgi:hypothetical protein
MVMESVQEALGETPQGTLRHLAPAQLASTFQIVETMFAHHFHHQKEWTIVNYLGYHLGYHLTH